MTSASEICSSRSTSNGARVRFHGLKRLEKLPATMIRWSENPVSHSYAHAIRLHGSINPVRPNLILEVRSPQAHSIPEGRVDASAQSKIGEMAVGKVILEIHLPVADQSLRIRPEPTCLVNRHTRTDQVVIFVNVLVLVEAQPAAFRLKLDPVPHAKIHIRTKTDERRRRLLSDADSIVVRLKDGPHAARTERERRSGGGCNNLCMGISCPGT